MAIVDIRPRGPRHRRSVVLSVDGKIKVQYAVPRGGEQSVILDLHNRIVDKFDGTLISTSADSTVLDANGLDWSKL